MDEKSTTNKIISHKQSKVCLMPIKLSHKVNNGKSNLLTVISYQQIKWQNINY